MGPLDSVNVYSSSLAVLDCFSRCEEYTVSEFLRSPLSDSLCFVSTSTFVTSVDLVGRHRAATECIVIS